MKNISNKNKKQNISYLKGNHGLYFYDKKTKI